MADKQITIGTDYTAVPGGRFRRYGDFSGEDFRDTVLVPALKDAEHVTVYLDGTKTYSNSFLEEAFGGLIRESGYTYDTLKQKLSVAARAPRYSIYVRMVEQDLQEAADRAGKKVAASAA